MSTPAVWARWVRVGVAASLLGIHLDGCATSGRTPGLSEPRAADPEAAEHLMLSRVSPGKEIRVTLRDGSMVTGKYRGVERMTDAAYRQRVEEFRATRGDSLALPPAPGTDIVVHQSRGRKKPARLTAYGFHSLELLWNGKGETRALTFDELESVTDSSGHEWTSGMLTVEASAGRLPSYAQLEMDTSEGRKAFPVDQVLNVYVHTTTGQWVTAGLLVVAMGVIILIAMAAGANQYYSGTQCSSPTPSWARQLSARGAP